MSYSWEDVALTIDIGQEEKREREELRGIKKEKDLEELWMKGGSFLAEVVCGLYGGPKWATICKNVAKYSADYVFDWEEDRVSEGKYKKEESKDINKELEDLAKDQFWGNIIDTATDLGSMWMQAGGPEALAAGETPDFTTFGHGDAEWLPLGRGEAPIDVTKLADNDALYDKLYETGVNAPGGIIPASEDYVESLWDPDAGKLANLLKIGGALGDISSSNITAEAVGAIASSEAACLAIGREWIDGKCV